ncbi:hypothetical protein GCM10023201_54140 [Actinomycetospora corticicola]|uniref:Uncharacterized protein n=1 Tax=Actinomycetospora corticicola TaxID=663602 RepID=A0A7Y9E050_9PSEU|nr:hypothetical protein [Actinomycetospora corticicola]NYD38596.1 hypothetical protein [Actinomycetospora corticicola]
MRRLVVLAAVLLGVLAGCGGTDNPASIPSGQSSEAAAPGVENRSPDAARNKLRLALADPCYTSSDPRAVWPRCGRWVEETASTARTAANALPDDPAVTAAAAQVGAARDSYVARGCPATAPGGTVDVGACVGGLVTARTAVDALSRALGSAP